MKVKIRKAQPGETPRFISKLNKFIKKAGGESDTIDAYIDYELSNGTSPEEVISALVEFKIPREKIEDTVYEMYDILQESDNYNSSSATAPYDQEAPYNKKVKDKEVVEEIPDSEKYGYYESNNLGSKLSKETDFDEDGEYAEGGQYMNDNVIPEAKQPYFVGMDANAVPASFAFGGTKQSKSKYIKDYIKKLKKAAEGEEVENSEFYLPPAGSIGDPMGNSTKQNKMFAGTVKQMGNDAMMKKQAEESYQNMNTKANGGAQEPHDWVDELHGYGEALQHSMTAMDENAINTAIMKKEYGRGGRIRRANKALFGTPNSIPGVNTSYEFGPLGGIRKATAEWDVKALGNLVNFLPGTQGMMPGRMSSSSSWKSVSYPSQVRQKVITSVNNKALDEVVGNTKSSSATQGHASSNKKGLNCPPGAVYDALSDQCIGSDGLPVGLLENPFANPYASMIPGSYQSKEQETLNKFIPPSPINPNGTATNNTEWMEENEYAFPETWTPEYLALVKAVSPEGYPETNKPWAPLTDPKGYVYNYNYLEGIDPATGLPLMDTDRNLKLDEDGKKFRKINANSAYYDSIVPSSPYSYLLDDEYTKAHNIKKFTDYTPEQQVQLKDYDQNSLLTRDKQGNEYSSENWTHGAPDYQEQVIDPANAGLQPFWDAKVFKGEEWNRFSPNTYQEEDGGFIDSSQMQPGVLQKFISGGNEYAYGGGIQRFAPGGGFDRWAKDKFNIDGSSKFKPKLSAELINPFAKTSTQGVPNKFLFGANSSNAFSNIPSSNIKQPAPANNTAPGQQQFTPEQIEQFLQYQKSQQGQPGSGVYAPGYGVNTNMMYGPPKKLGFGFSKDFSYTQGFSPNWTVPEGTQHMRQETYKDRGNKLNPFDNKRITDWYADNGMKDPATNVDMEDTATVTPGADGTSPGTSSDTQDIKKFQDSQTAQGKVWDEQKQRWVNSGYNPTATGPGYSGYNADSEGNNIPDYLQPGVMSGSAPAAQPVGPNLAVGNPGVPVVGATNTTYQPSAPQTNAVDPSNPIGPANTDTDGSSQPQQSGAPYNNSGPGVENSDLDNMPAPSGNTQGASLSNPGLANPFLQNNGLQNPLGAPVNQFSVIRRQQGGFIPSYAQFLEYGGYIPKARPGIVVDQPEFSDPNFVGRTITQNAYTFDPKQMGADLFGKGSLTDIVTKGANSWSQAKQDEAFREQNRSSDAASPNTGQSGFGSAEIAGSQMGDAGYQNQYGKLIQNIGSDGNNVVTKMGGTPNKQYQKGRGYTLTLKQIKEIEAAGGKIEYLKNN